MTYDVDAVRSHFPALKEGAAHFDGPGGSQTPDLVARAVHDTLVSAVANRDTVTPAERRAEQIVTDFRATLGDLLATDPRGIVYGRSATALTYDFSRALARTWAPGDEVVVTRLDHDSNIRPWVQAAAAVGATVRWVDFDPATGELSVDAIAEQLTDRTRLVATTAASNLIGTRPRWPTSPRSPTTPGRSIGSTGSTPRRTSASIEKRAAPTSGPAHPTSSSDPTVACSPPTRRCSRP